MLVVTGVMIGFVLVVMVGQTARTMQGTGWIPITSLDVDPPYWLGLWFGVYPTWETVGAQIAAAAFVIGSFFLAKELKIRRPQRRAVRLKGNQVDSGASRGNGMIPKQCEPLTTSLAGPRPGSPPSQLVEAIPHAAESPPTDRPSGGHR
jgi:high-affinity iron transporter